MRLINAWSWITQKSCKKRGINLIAASLFEDYSISSIGRAPEGGWDFKLKNLASRDFCSFRHEFVIHERSSFRARLSPQRPHCCCAECDNKLECLCTSFIRNRLKRALPAKHKFRMFMNEIGFWKLPRRAFEMLREEFLGKSFVHHRVRRLAGSDDGSCERR